MGIIRGGLFIVVCVLFFVTLLASNSFLTIERSLDYNVIKSELTNVSTDLAKDDISDSLINIQNSCLNNSEFIFEDGEAQDVVLPCDVALQGKDAIITYTVDKIVEKNYYQIYDCDYWDCFKKLEGNDKLLFSVSQQAKDYWAGKFYFSLFILLILAGVMFLFIENKLNFPIVAGALVVVASLPFTKLEAVIGIFAKIEILQYLTIFFSKSSSVFLTGLVIGLILIGIGVVSRFFKIGFQIQDFFEKFRSKKNSSENIEEEPLKKKTKSKSKKN